MDERVVLISIGCAECRYNNEPLVDKLQYFNSMDEAKVRVGGDFRPHPAGGVYRADGDGDEWIVPVSVFNPKEG